MTKVKSSYNYFVLYYFILLINYISQILVVLLYRLDYPFNDMNSTW